MNTQLRWMAGISILCSALAGCVGGSEDAIDPFATQEEFPAAGAVSSSTQGAVEGIVLDTSLAPIPNAAVTLALADKNAQPLASTTSGMSGEFVFSLLEPGTYRITVAPPGFSNTSALVNVFAGEITRAQVLLEDRPGDEPYRELLLYRGWVACFLMYVVAGYNGLPPDPCPFGEKKTDLNVEVPASWRYYVNEMSWSGSESMALITARDEPTCAVPPDGKCYGMVQGASSLRLEGAPGDVVLAQKYSFDGKTAPPDGNFSMWVTMGYSGYLRNELNDTAGPACVAVHGAVGYSDRVGCFGVGYATGIAFDYYVSIFHYERLVDPERYSAVPDG